LILLVLVQTEEGDSLGGIFAGGSGSAFGSRSGNVLTRTTTVLGALFLVLSLGLALINRSPGTSGVEAAGRELSQDVDNDWWQETPPADNPDVSAEDFDVSEGGFQDLFIQDPVLPEETPQE
jgi:preprotein translocase subunit SecG